MSIKTLCALSEPLTFELEPNNVLDPPRITLRIAPLAPGLSLTLGAAGSEGAQGITELFAWAVLEAIKEWDLTDPDRHEPIPCTNEYKRRLLYSWLELLGTKVKGKTTSLFMELIAHATNHGNYLKN